MSGTILENLSGRKLAVLVSVLCVGQLACFLAGGFFAPSPAGSFPITAIVCVDPQPDNADPQRFLTKDCPQVDLAHMDDADMSQHAQNLVFVMTMPTGMRRGFSRLQQNLVGVLDFQIEHHKAFQMDNLIELTLDARLAYSNAGSDSTWTHYAHATEKRLMACALKEVDEENYDCSSVPLFELGAVHHDYYLLNLRLPTATTRNNFGLLYGITLHVIHMNGGFTIVWLALKAIFFPLIVGVMSWFWHRVHILERQPALLEYMLIYLGGTLAFLDLPLELLTLVVEMPYMLLLSDIRQGIFYAMLLSFWIVFAGEHMLIGEPVRSLRSYWKHLSAIVIGCTSLLIFDLCERGVQLRNPFYTIWVTPIGANLALSFIILAGISACMYFVFLCYMIWQVFKNISIKRTSLPNMSSARRLHYEGIIYRFNFLMLATLLCAAVTIASFIVSQVNEGNHKLDEDDNEEIELLSAMFTAVYGMWNMYIIAMLILYAPSHKKWPSEPICGENGEEVEFNHLPSDCSANEISSLTSFARKSTLD